ncbi:MAG: hypothetical protein PUD90_10975 [Clostridia bacterium]|jgi:hypothetical protein|nr:hypothetical protein [[Bacteroides] pectinophilus]MDD5873958.1 hypothetical protein [Clostridia bacterium]
MSSTALKLLAAFLMLIGVACGTEKGCFWHITDCRWLVIFAVIFMLMYNGKKNAR